MEDKEPRVPEPGREEEENFGLAALYPRQETKGLVSEKPLGPEPIGPSLFQYGLSRPKSEVGKWLIPALGAGLALVLVLAFWDSLPMSVWLAGDPQVASEALYDKAREDKEAGRSKEAIGEFRRLIRKYPHSSQAREALFLLGELERQHKESVSALERYGAVIARKGEDSLALEARLRRAEIYFGFGKNEEGIRELAPFWADSLRSRKAFEARMLAASTLASMGQADSALILYEAVARSDTAGWYKAQVRKNIARIYEGKADFPMARAQYESVAASTGEQDPLHTWALEQAIAMKDKERSR